jgi:hypothetical protein
MPPELEDLLRTRLSLDRSPSSGSCHDAPPGMLDFARSGLGPAGLARKLARRRARGRAAGPATQDPGRKAPEAGGAAADRDETTRLPTARADLLGMVERIEDHVKSATVRFLLADQAVQAGEVEERGIDLASGEGAGHGAAAVLERTAGQMALKAADKAASTVGLATHLGFAAKLLISVKDVLDQSTTARQSLAHRRATRRVVRAALHDLSLYCERQRAAIGAAGSLDELRRVGAEIVAMLHEARGEVRVIAELQAWVVRLETQDPAYTAVGVIERTSSQRTGLGAALDEEGAEGEPE